MTATRHLTAAELHGRPLSPRELRVLVLAAHGLDNASIGRQLYLSTATVKEYMRTAVRKLGARTRTHAVYLAYDLIAAQESQ